MGCWNQTCGLTQLHILDGEAVIVFPLASTQRDSLCYTTPFFCPFPLPFYGKYDDYGSASDCTGIGLELAMNYIGNKLLVDGSDSGNSRDPITTIPHFSVDQFWKITHRGVLTIGGFGNDQHRVDKVMIKQSIFDHLAETYMFSVYDYSNELRKGEYYHYNFNTVLQGVGEIADILIKRAGTDVFDGLPPETSKLAMRRWLMMNPIGEAASSLVETSDGTRLPKKDQNRAAGWLAHESSHLRYGPFATRVIDDLVVSLAEKGDREKVIEVLQDYLKMLFIDNVMSETRKFWSPQAGAGSQNCDPDGYRHLMAAMSAVLDEEDKRWDDDDEDE